MSPRTKVLAAALLLIGVAGCVGMEKNKSKVKEVDDSDLASAAAYGRVQVGALPADSKEADAAATLQLREPQLNTRAPQGSSLFDREWEYASFMARMRNNIAKQWFPMVRDATRQRDPDGSVYFYRERTVVLSLVIDTAGNVKDMSVKQSSNVDFFDRIAMRSVRNAQPFPNPPSGMFHGEGQVSVPLSFTMHPHDRDGGRATEH
jgi:TonB family protein